MIARLTGLAAIHAIEKFWEYRRRERLPVQHPVLLRHPLAGRDVIYVNPGFTVKIDGLPEAESAELLRTLLAHIMREKYRYVHEWMIGDLLLWDHLGTWHYARADYGPASTGL